MLAACGTVLVSCLGYRCCGSVRGGIDVAPPERVCIEHPHPSHLFYSLPIISFTSEEIDPLPNGNSNMSRSWPWHFAILSLPQARHALVIHLSVMIPLLIFQRQRYNMHLVSRQLAILVLPAKDVSAICEDCENVVRAREEGGAGDSFECRAQRLGGLGEAVGSDGAAFDGGREDLLGRYEASHCSWVHIGKS